MSELNEPFGPASISIYSRQPTVYCSVIINIIDANIHRLFLKWCENTNQDKDELDTSIL